jgi:hypothetical protein
MRIYSLFFTFFLVILFGLLSVSTVEAGHLAAPDCAGYSGKFTATNWPAGKKATITCQGAGKKVGKCVGESTSVAPGGSFHFSKCNCLDKSRPCFAVTGLPAGCTVKSKPACAANRQSVNGGVTVSCSKTATTSPRASTTPSRSTSPTGGTPMAGTPTGETLTGSVSPANPTNEPTATPAPPGYQLQEVQSPTYYCLKLGDGTCKKE